MPTKLKRMTVNMENWLYDLLHEDGKRNERTDSQQMIFIAKRYYAEREQEAGLFGDQRPSRGRDWKPPFLGTPQEPAPPSKKRANQGLK